MRQKLKKSTKQWSKKNKLMNKEDESDLLRWLQDKEVEVAIEEVDEKELFKAAKDCGLKFADMEILEAVMAEA